MYQRFYGLNELPFELTPNPDFLFLTPRHREALSNLLYGVSTAKALTLLLGDAGTGKTTLLQTAMESPEFSRVRAVFLSNPALTSQDFVRTLASRFDLGPRATESKAAFLDELERMLRDCRARGEIAVLVVDEAQSLSRDVLEEIRLLGNIETRSEKLLPLILAGQPEFAAKLNDPTLRQLKQRVALRCQIAHFELPETAAYIASRITRAGGDSSELFTREAVQAVHEYSHGIPRTINVVCDNALLTGLALGRQPVGRDIIQEVARDFDLKPEVVADRRAEERLQAVAVPAERPAPAPAPAPAERPAPAPRLAPAERPMLAERPAPPEADEPQ